MQEILTDILLYDRANPLLFNTGLFLLLFVGFLLIYHALRRWHTVKMLFVIAFSLYFYYKSSAQYCFILLGVCISDYALGRWLGAVANNAGRRAIVWLNVVINVGMLVYFKYFNLLYETFANITSTSFDPLDIILPAGISFFTFRSISYMVDIYRREIEPCRNFLDYTFFLTFFPPLLAGPVVRAKDMLPQIKENPVATRAMVAEGLFLIIAGLIKKVVIADYISGNFVDRIFDNPSLYTGFENMMGAVGFALQLYCDFSGYSDMAIGIALLLGFRFPKNFDAPYKSATITEFWRRWHISLSSWLRDYLYISLGGNRKGRVRTYFNLMVTMVLGGLWHGAALRFVLWGGIHGMALALHKLWLSVVPGAKAAGSEMKRGWRIAGIFLTFNLVCFSWLMFRAESMQTVTLMLHQIFFDFNAPVIPQVLTGYTAVFAFIAAGYVLHFVPARIDERIRSGVTQAPMALQVLLMAAMIWSVMQIKSSDIQPFIYFQF